MTGLLLDTHIWIWLMEAQPNLSERVRHLINTAATEHQVFIAAISLWEMSMLVMKQRITLATSELNWITQALALPGITLTPLTPAIAVESCQLPENFHGDPADRLLVATARIHNLALVTADEKIIAYAKKHYVSVIAS